MATKCIICEKDIKGIPVSEDIMIRGIRKIKQTLNIAQNNKLVVCQKCLPEHQKRRSGFEKKVVRYGAVGFIIAVVLFLLAPSLNALLAGAFLLLLMLSFTLTSYHPALVSNPENEKEKKKGKSAKQRK